MPSGAKKRKAAKKKKELQQVHGHPEDGNNSLLINGQGNGDKKAEDERSSDSSELNSPASDRSPHHRRTFDEGSGVPVKGGPSQIEPAAAEDKPTATEEVIGEAAGHKEAGQLSNPAKLKEDFKSVQDDRSSTSSSSDGESSPVENKKKEVHITSASESSKNIEDTVGSSTNDAIPNEGSSTNPPQKLDTPVVTMSRVVEPQVEATQVGNTEVIDVVERGLKENEVKLLPTSYLANERLEPLDSGTAETSINQNGRATAASTEADSTKDNRVSESTENQPLVASAPRLAQRTSWLSCCGLFGD